MIKFVCNTCLTSYQAELNGGEIIYMQGQQRRRVGRDDDPCWSCEEKINMAIIETKKRIRQQKIITEDKVF